MHHLSLHPHNHPLCPSPEPLLRTFLPLQSFLLLNHHGRSVKKLCMCMQQPPNSRGDSSQLMGNLSVIQPPPEFFHPTPKKLPSPIPPLLFFCSKNSLQFYLMKDTFMNNQMILIKILLKDVKTSYLPRPRSLSLGCSHPGFLQTEPPSDFSFWGCVKVSQR